MNRFLIITLLFILSLWGCKKDEILITSTNEGITGIWAKPVYSDTLVTFERVKNLVENEYGIVFYPDNKLLERKNNSFCGTPPITTSDYTGNWVLNDSVVNISVAYWGGTAKYIWKIEKITLNILTISIVDQKYHSEK